MDYTQEEQLALKLFADDEKTFATILKVAKKRLEKEKELIVEKVMLSTDRISNETMGEHLRAVGEGIKLVESIFREISMFKSVQKSVDKVNPAR